MYLLTLECRVKLLCAFSIFHLVSHFDMPISYLHAVRRFLHIIAVEGAHESSGGESSSVV